MPMASASASTPNNSKNGSNFSDNSPSKSHFRKTVCLKDWWLEKPANNSEVEVSPVVIAGITSREKRAVRVFSAPILKRCDVFYLETVDGVFVIIQGFINKARTEANGFSSEIVKHFLFGFPLDWDIYAKRFYMGESPLSSEAIKSKDEDILTKCGSLDGDDEIGNGEAVSAYKSGGRSVVKQTVNNSDTTGITPQSHDTRGRFNSPKQKKTFLGRRKQSISRSSTPRAEKPKKKLAYGSSASHEQKDASAVSPLSSSLKRSRSGRLLLPRLEFWRDQRAVYNVDRQITGVKDLKLNALSGEYHPQEEVEEDHPQSSL